MAEQVVRRMGEPFEKALCKNCDQAIFHIWWGNGGTIWEHIATFLPECRKVQYAEPDRSTLLSVDGRGSE